MFCGSVVSGWWLSCFWFGWVGKNDLINTDFLSWSFGWVGGYVLWVGGWWVVVVVVLWVWVGWWVCFVGRWLVGGGRRVCNMGMFGKNRDVLY